MIRTNSFSPTSSNCSTLSKSDVSWIFESQNVLSSQLNTLCLSLLSYWLDLVGFELRIIASGF